MQLHLLLIMIATVTIKQLALKKEHNQQQIFNTQITDREKQVKTNVSNQFNYIQDMHHYNVDNNEFLC